MLSPTPEPSRAQLASVMGGPSRAQLASVVGWPSVDALSCVQPVNVCQCKWLHCIDRTKGVKATLCLLLAVKDRKNMLI